MNDFKILVCAHKKTPLIQDENFPPILLGSQFANDELKEAYKDAFWDNMGENIARLHPVCAELTAIYWIWKNYEKLGNPKYVGLFHYRRFFNFKKELDEPDLWKCAFFDFDEDTKRRFGWDEETISSFCNGYDLILPHKEEILDPKDWQTPVSLETHYDHGHYPEDFDLAMNLIKKVHPKYTEAVERARNSHYGYFCNMFVMTKELFMDYAQWLFDIILPLEDLLPITDSKYDNISQKRVLGFLGERLFNIWIDYQSHNPEVKIRKTQRLIGYLSNEEQMQYASAHGMEGFLRAKVASKEYEMPYDENAKDVGYAIVHEARQKTKPAVSVLGAVYNVAPFLGECIDSLLQQTLEDIEFIFVDNVSTDQSLSILMKYYQKDPRITVIEHKQNMGLPGSRNTAMKFARGKYLSFIDTDDVCHETMFEKLYNKAEELGADIVTCSVMGFEDTLSNHYLHRPLEWYDKSDRLLPLTQRPQQLMEPAAWCKLFRTEYIRNLDYFEFRPGVVAWEDVPAMTSAFIQTDRIATVQEALYYYRQRNVGNLSNGMNRRHVNEFISGVNKQKAILEAHDFQDEEVLSWMEEFKFLYMEWVLSKLSRRDIPYLFHKAGRLFQFKNRKYLTRLFDYTPKRRFVYFAFVLRSAFLYYFGRFLFRAAKRTKVTLKRIFDIKRDSCYRLFKIGPLRFKIFRKKFSLDTINWLNWQWNESKVALAQTNKKNASLESTCHKLEQENAKLAEKAKHWDITSQINEKLRYIGSLLEKSNQALSSSNADFQAQNAQLEKQNSELQNRYTDLSEKYTGQLTENKAQSEKITELSTRVGSYEQLYSGFFRAVWTTGWIDKWKEYYYTHYQEIDQKKAALEASMDMESCETIERHCYRNFTLLPMQKESDLFLFHHEKIYTAEELYGASHPFDTAAYRNKYHIEDSLILETPVFEFHCGLKLLPPSALEKIRERDVIDGGAYWGDSALIFSEYGPKSIHAFEPHPVTYRQLQKTISDNGSDSVIHAVKSGLGESDGDRTLYTNGMSSGSNLDNVSPVSNDGPTEANLIQIQSIDEYVSENHLNVGLIKLDIEGNESAAIHGAMETIRKCRPVLSIALYHKPEDFFDIKPLLEAQNLGYHFMVRKLVYHDLVTEVILLGYTD